MRVKQSRISEAPKARRSKAQGEGARGSGLRNPGYKRGCTQSPERAAQSACVALSGLFLFRLLTQGFGRFAAFALGFAAPRFQRLMKPSLT